MSGLQVREEAAAELDAALEWYAAESPVLAAAFAADVNSALARIQETPERWSPYVLGTRRVLLRRFPFSVVYQITDAAVVVIAVTHHSRRPGYWLRRVRTK